MQIRTNVNDRKKVVKLLAEFLDEQAIYLGPPTFSYQIGECTVDRDGTITVESEEMEEKLKEKLKGEGYLETESAAEPEELAADIKIPLTGFTPQGIINLVNMIYSKQYLINKSIGKENIKISDALIEALGKAEFTTAAEAVTFIKEFNEKSEGISFDDGCISFLGFPAEAEKSKAYMELATAMILFAKNAKKVSGKQTIEENEKYYMRVWLVRLGFAGKEAKETRKILLQNLKGHTAFRTESDKEKWNERQKARKNAESEVE